MEENFRNARAHEYGTGVEQSWEKAFVYYKAAVKKGNPKAQYALAEWYREGIYVKKSCVDAVLHYIRAAKMGDERSGEKLKRLRERDFVRTVETALKYAPVFGVSHIQRNLGLNLSQTCAMIGRMVEFGMADMESKDFTKRRLLIGRAEWDVIKNFLEIKD